MDKGRLFMIPNLIASVNPDTCFSNLWKTEITHIRHFVVEDVRSARQFLSSLKIFPSIEELNFGVLNRETPAEALPGLLSVLQEGKDIGIISESGCPGVADPGSLAVAWAHDHHIQVRPMVGPSSIILALMASGMNGQRFTFQGYLPIEQQTLHAAISRLEKESKSGNITQIFIESPHRNNRLLGSLKKVLSPQVRLCVACDLTGPTEKIISGMVQNWPEIELPKMPCIFLFQA
jgi:16S rRNA (cytidine1402-2'-O)-methyltransferase